MAYLLPKAKKPMAWLPSQVAYGVDCSDPDPKNWQTFGELHEKAQQESAKHNSKVPDKAA